MLQHARLHSQALIVVTFTAGGEVPSEPSAPAAAGGGAAGIFIHGCWHSGFHIASMVLKFLDVFRLHTYEVALEVL